MRTFEDAVQLRTRLKPGRHIVVIGAGFIGLEVAVSAREIGCAVTVIEVGPRILMRGVPEQIAQIVEARHRKAGVAFQLGVGILQIERDLDGYSVTLADGTVIRADDIIVGIGAVPEISLAENCGLKIENGISLNETLTTSDPDIFAAGDCCSFPHHLYGGRRIRLEAWRNAQDQGTHAALTMLGGSDTYMAIPWFWSDQYDLTLKVSGLPDSGEKTVCRELSESDKLYFHLSNDNRLMAASAIGTNANISKELRIAEMLISKQVIVNPGELTDVGVRLGNWTQRPIQK